MKLLPLHAEEDADHIVSTRLRVVGCHFATKVICMGVVTKPYPHHGFDGKIDLLQVAKRERERECQKTKCLNNSFSHNLDANEAAKNGWCNVAFGPTN